MTLILRRLQQEGMLEFSQLFVVQEGVQKMVTYFLALLELAREGLVKMTQQVAYSAIYVQAAELMA
jgi:segregation and condensation protein A